MCSCTWEPLSLPGWKSSSVRSLSQGLIQSRIRRASGSQGAFLSVDYLMTTLANSAMSVMGDRGLLECKRDITIEFKKTVLSTCGFTYLALPEQYVRLWAKRQFLSESAAQKQKF